MGEFPIQVGDPGEQVPADPLRLQRLARVLVGYAGDLLATSFLSVAVLRLGGDV